MRDKDVASMLRILAPHASHFVMTQARGHRAMSAGELIDLAAALAPEVPRTRAADALHALDTAFADSAFAIAAGSIFLIGELLPALSDWS
jgi:folylpolyglutamate synthase/dihydropteroate synthase